MQSEQLSIKILADIKDIVSKLKELDTRFDKFSSEVKENVGNASKAINGITGSLAKFGLAIQGAQMIFHSLNGILGGLISSQSDYTESLSKFQVVFGRFAESTLSWAEEYGKQVGRSKSEMVGWLSTFQDTFVPLGFARGKAAELSKELVQLAIDVASFNNAFEPDVIRDFQSALVGNHETVRKYGIVITEEMLKQEALRTGIVKTERELTAQEKVYARLSLIINGTKDAQGDAIRTADSYANQSKALQAALQDLKVELGEFLIPAFKEVVKWLKSLLTTIQNAPKEVQGLILVFGGLTATLVTLNMTGLTPLISNIPRLIALMNGLKIAGMGLNWILGGIGLVLGGGYLLWKQYREQVDRMKDSTHGLSASLEELNMKLTPGDIKILDSAVTELGDSTQLTDEEIKNLSSDLKALQEIRDKQEELSFSNPKLEDQANILQNRILNIVQSVSDLSNLSSDTKAKLIELFNIDPSVFQKPITVYRQSLESELEKQERLIASAHEFEKMSAEEKITHLQSIYNDFYKRRDELSDEEVKKAIEVKKEILRLEEEKQKEQERLSRELEQLRNNERTLGLEGYRDYLQKRLELIKGSSLQEQVEREKLAQKIADIDRRIAEKRKEQQERGQAEFEQMIKEREMRIQGFANYYASVFASGGIEGVYSSMLQSMETEFYAWVIKQVHLYEWMETAKAGILLVWTKVRMGIELMYDRLKETLHLKEMFRTGKEMVQNAMAAGVRAVKSAAAIPFPGNVLAIGGAIAAVVGAIALVKNKVASLVKMAEGGVVEKATLALIGEMGPEVVAPKVNFERYVTQTLTPMIQNQINHKTEFKQDLTPLKSEFKEGFERLEKAIYQSKIDEKRLAREVFRLKRGSL